MSPYEQARHNVRLAYFHGQRYRRPNGEWGTVLMCPWPGCKEEAVEGWSACSAHFQNMHPQRREAPRARVREPDRTPLFFWSVA